MQRSVKYSRGRGHLIISVQVGRQSVNDGQRHSGRNGPSGDHHALPESFILMNKQQINEISGTLGILTRAFLVLLR